MKDWKRFWVIAPAAILLALLVGWYMTRGEMEQLSFLKQNQGAELGLVDQRPWQTASTLAPLAVSAEEQGYAREAERLADYEVDQAFAMALRQASLQRRVLTGEALTLDQKVTTLKQTVADDKAKVDAMTAANAKAGIPPAEGDDLDVAKAQLGLDTDELTDATQDLARASGDQRAEIQQELQQHEAALKKTGAISNEIALIVLKRYATLWGRVKAWFEQRSRAALLADAEQRARKDAKTLAAQHDALEKKSVPSDMAKGSALTGLARVKMLQSLAAQRGIMSILDDRVQADQQLAAVYAKWQAQVWVQHRIVMHLILDSLITIVFIIVVIGLASKISKAALSRFSSDPRKSETLDTIITLAAQVVGGVLILLVLFGMPQQTPTILGLATAGFTVVFQDYILAFFGWFILMGRNGVRAGDWVEIDSIGGEVSEIGLFRTVLLETGNWTSQGHPTGRRITFSNSFAIKGQYFNFSTNGQWMWDEIQVHVPAEIDGSAVIGRMQEALKEDLARDTARADLEWRGVTGATGLGQFSSAPTLDLRPAAAGVDLIVRFMTRASERFEHRNQLYERVLQILADGAAPSSAPQASAPQTSAPQPQPSELQTSLPQPSAAQESSLQPSRETVEPAKT